MSRIDIYYLYDEAPGWAPVTSMAFLAEKVFGSCLCLISANNKKTRSSAVKGIARLANIRKVKGQSSTALLIANRPNDLLHLAGLVGDIADYKIRAAWIIDSFHSGIALNRRLLSAFDAVAFTQAYEHDNYSRLVGDRSLWLGWGSDVLGYGAWEGDRPIDVLRVGRQPEAWEDDSETGKTCAAAGLQFQGRPPFEGEHHTIQHANLMKNYYSKSKFVLAQTNLVSKDIYTHKRKEYITARWVDALACGAVLAGVPPKSDTGLISWPEGLLEFSKADLRTNVQTLTEAAAKWTPKIARRNYTEALGRLDWRWRFKALSEKLALDSSHLEEEIHMLEHAICQSRTELEQHTE